MVLAKRRRARRSTRRRRRNVQTTDPHGACRKNRSQKKGTRDSHLRSRASQVKQKTKVREAFRAPLGLLEPPKIREPTLGWETAFIAKAESRARPKLK